MINEESKWTANCDRCDKAFEIMGRYYACAFKCSIEADLKTNGWRVKGNKCYCPECKDKGGKV